MDQEVTYEQKDNRIDFHFDHIYFENPQRFGSIDLFQVGDLSCQGGYVVNEHEQICYELTYIVSGRGWLKAGGTSHPVKEGDIVLNVPGELHACRADDEDPFRYYYVGFDFAEGEAGDAGEVGDAPALEPIRKMFDQTTQPVVSNLLGIEAPFAGIFKELVNLKSYSSFMIGSYLQQLIVLAYRSFHDSRETAYSPMLQGKEMTKPVHDVIRYIEHNWLRMTELGAMAEELHYSYSYLSHQFSKEMGLTIQEYYNRKRFEQAVKLLREGRLTVTQIADKLRYQSIHSFSKAFRLHFGISPTEYQSIATSANQV
ncbi:AraC family transcriptional regulator [Cohnella sp. GbtcB17]|uniref:AraC family transcriptional regulator n=1 Tax=Cohnella sp. GbtcB17 TaxID=2824762 RepID=UPI001C30F70D|nr:AraC family transcriptional regulator [Cohnella sp. GbtcB17]